MAALSYDDSTLASCPRTTPRFCRPARAGDFASPFGRPIALAVDEPVPAKHQTRRLAPRTSLLRRAPGRAMGFSPSTTLAIISLVFVSAVALGSLLASTAVLHLAYPVVASTTSERFMNLSCSVVLIGLAVFWLLPPHPWAAEPARSEPKERRPPSEGGRLMARFDPQMLRLASGTSRSVWRSRKGR